jgi:hypothetical protein
MGGKVNPRTRQVTWSALLILTSAFGCSKGEPNNFPTPGAADDGGLPNRVVPDGSSTSDGGGSGPPDGAMLDASLLKITVDIESPKAEEAVSAAMRFTPSVSVTIDSSMAKDTDNISELLATVTKVGAKMSSASAKLSETKLEQAPGSAVAIHRFTDTPVDISTLDSGTYQLKAAVKTIGGLTAEATRMFVIDAGPVIRIDSPGENKFYRNSVTVDVTVTDTLFGPVDKVTMLLGQRTLTISGPSGTGQYTGTIQFNSYDPPLEGDQLLTVRATNKRGTEAVVRRKFISDNRGPDITMTVPATGALIGKVITISAVVKDPAGVLDSSVVAVVAHGNVMFEVKLEPAAAGSMAQPGTYLALFDTTRLPVNAIYPSISFRASDIPGNQSSVGYLVSLDNTPPLADLDPPTDFHSVKKDGDFFRCSWPFDPLGTDAVNDGATKAQLFDIRARIEDEGNRPLFGGADVIPISGIDDTRVHLLILDDTSNALVVDTNGDGFCDAVNPLLTPTTTPMSDKDALLVNMAPITPGGGADYTPRVPDPGAPCLSGSDAKPPEPLCLTTNLSQAIAYSSPALPAIYTVPPVVPGGQCVGRQFDALGNNVADGWICLAVAVSDKLGNSQVSRPLRVCIDKDGVGGECGASKPPMPDCTGTQTMSKPNVVIDTAKPCKPWDSYPATEYRRIN